MRTVTARYRAFSLALLSALGSASAQTTAVPTEPDVDPYFVESSAVTSPTAPPVITRNIHSDHNGNLWLATWSGVVRYDGETFTNITNQEGLRRYRAFSVLSDRQQNIWVGTVGAGVYRYDGDTYTNFTEKDGLGSDVILSMMQDRDGHIWFGGHGVTRYDGDSFISFGAYDGFTDRDVNAIAQGTDGTIWFGTRGALFRSDGETFINFTEEHAVNPHPNAYTPVVVDRRGHVWFGGEHGLYHFDGQRVQHLIEPACYSIFEDSRGHIWFTGGALIGETVPKPGISILSRFDPAAGLENILTARKQFEIDGGRGIFEITEDTEGNIWFGTGRGAERIDADAAQKPGRWDQAAAAIKASSQYGGFDIEPQQGLIPLGANPESGLHEFLHLATHTGAIPQRDRDSHIAMTSETGIIFVLIPKGTFWMGSQNTDPQGPNFDPQSLPGEQLREVEIDVPFFLSKYEMTRGQWQRSPADEKNPSRHGGEAALDVPLEGDFPVDNITWQMSMTAMQQMGLGLPTEEQWEYAARAGTSSPWIGNTRTVEGIAAWGNIAAGPSRGFPDNAATREDNYANSAPVGRFRANGFGLHDVLGNVWEWTAQPQMNRGGSFLSAAHFARAAYTGGRAAGHRGPGQGVRPVRGLDRHINPSH